MRVTWIATTTKPVSEITAMQRILSEATSNNKRTSTNKRALGLIGFYLKQFIHSAPCVSDRWRPDTKNHLIPNMKMLKGVEVDKALKAVQHDEQRVFPHFEFLFSDTYEAYYANPRDGAIAQKVYSHFRYPSISHPLRILFHRNPAVRFSATMFLRGKSTCGS